MIRDGSERLTLGRIGIEMIERATYPSEVRSPIRGSETLRLYVAKTSFTAALRASGKGVDARYCDRQFRTNDAWVAFRNVEDPQARYEWLGIAAVQADVAPGAFLVAALGGGLLWSLGRRAGVVATTTHRFRGSGITACSLLLLVCGALLGYPLVGLAAGACALVAAAGPSRPRRYDGGPLGPLHVLVVGTFVVVAGGGIAQAAIAQSLPGQLLPRLDAFGPLLGDAARWGAALVAVLGASALVAPAWAEVRRLPTTALAASTYRNAGRALVFGGLALAIVSSPVALVLDRLLGNSLAEIALNEQIAYRPSEVRTP